MRIVVHGQQAFGEAVLEKLLQHKEDVVAVCTAPDKEGRRSNEVIRCRYLHDGLCPVVCASTCA